MIPSPLLSREAFHPLCPNALLFYTCSFNSEFLGCCRLDPCVNGCVENDVLPASYEGDYESAPEGQCPDGSLWYLCDTINPKFMGCCASNACQQGGCPSQDLRGGKGVVRQCFFGGESGLSR